MTPDDLNGQKVELLSCWASLPYGAPDATSEVSRIEGFYTVERLTAFGIGQCGEAECAMGLALAA